MLTRTSRAKPAISFGTVAFGSIAILLLVWLVVMANSQSLIESLSSVSSTVRIFSDRPGLILGVGLVASMLFTVIAVALLARRPSVFMGLLAVSLILAEAAIPVLQQISLLLRYAMMLVLIVAGAMVLVGSLNKKWFLAQKLGLLILFWVLIHVAVDGFDPSTALLIPTQFAIFVGIFFAVPKLYPDQESTRHLCYGLALAGLAMTIINVVGLVMAPQPFLGGRFKSWYQLPTNFSNGYVLLLVSMVWAFMDCKQVVFKLVFAAATVMGLIMILLSATRNALVVAAVAIFLFSFLWKRQYLAYVAIGGVLVILLASAFNYGIQDIGDAGDRLSQGVGQKETRFLVWERCWLYIQQHPFWGYGLSADLKTFDNLLPVWMRFDPHNSYLGYWLRLGVVGMLLCLALYLHSLWVGYKTIKQHRKMGADLSVLTLFISLLACLFVSGIFEDNLASRGNVQQLFWALSIAIIMNAAKQKALWLPQRQQRAFSVKN